MIKRVSGSLYVRLFSQFVDHFLRCDVQRARAHFGEQKVQGSYGEHCHQKTKRSAEEQQVIEDDFEACLKQALEQTYKAELETGYDMTTIMGGKVFLEILTNAIDKELIVRNVPTKTEERLMAYELMVLGTTG